MQKLAILISHIPGPRILKRVKYLENDFVITVIYWDRGRSVEETFEMNPKNKAIRINIKAPQGRPMARIIPLMKYMFRAVRALQQEKPDLIQADNLDMLLIASVYKHFFDKTTKIIYEVVDLNNYAFVKRIKSPKDLVARFLQLVEKKLTTSVSKLLLSSPYFWEEYFSKFIDPEKYLFVSNAPSKALFQTYRKKERPNFTIGFIGSVRYVEQLKMLIDAVEESGSNIHILIAGDGPGYDEIERYCRGKAFVDLYGYYNYEKEIISLYEKVDCIYAVYDTRFPNVRIALPNRLYEAIVCELPIIAAKGTMLGKIIEENQIGITVNSDNKEELKRKLLGLVYSKERMDFYRKNCAKIKNDYYYESNMENLLKAYKGG